MITLWALSATLALANLDSGAPDKARGTTPAAEPAIALEEKAPATAEARPEWVSAAPETVDGTYFVTVDSGPFASEGEALEQLDEALVASAENHVNDYLGHADAAKYFDLSPARLRSELVRGSETYTETRSYSFGEMHHAYARLAFDSTFHNALRGQWHEWQSWFRLARFAALGLLGTATLATLFTWLRLDTFTRGLHTTGLRLAATAAILGLVAAGYFAVQRIPAL